LSANLPNPFANIPAFAGTGRAGTVISRSSLLSAYPHFSAIGYYTYDGQSWYDALNMKLEKRFSHGYLGLRHVHVLQIPRRQQPAQRG
jgi:hypothetical protein